MTDTLTRPRTLHLHRIHWLRSRFKWCSLGTMRFNDHDAIESQYADPQEMVEVLTYIASRLMTNELRCAFMAGLGLGPFDAHPKSQRQRFKMLRARSLTTLDAIERDWEHATQYAAEELLQVAERHLAARLVVAGAVNQLGPIGADAILQIIEEREMLYRQTSV